MEMWTPLFSGIVSASIWELPYHCRIVWVAIIAIKDRKGFVWASVPGLARLANVTREECEDALRRFESPDEDSKCQERRGQKLLKVAGGWQVLGHERNQEKMHEVGEEIRKMKNAARQAKWRKNQQLKNGTPLKGEVPYVEALKAGAPEEVLDKLSEP